MLSVIGSCALAGIDAYPVTVEVDITSGLPGFTMVGLPDSAVKESRERVFAALKNSGFAIPSKRITVNLAPGGIRKEGTAFDLPLALGILQASEQIQVPSFEGLVFMGELSLDGGMRPVRGALPAAIYAMQSGRRGLVLPCDNGDEASMVQGAAVFPVDNLQEALEMLKHPQLKPPPWKAGTRAKPTASGLDFADVKGQGEAKRALEIAAAGGHNFILVGSPGCGKTLLARRFPYILPGMTEEECLETTRIYSVAGLLKPGKGLLRQRPFRAPHHSISDQALVGGGGGSRPGEVSLAHNGVLFLDELPEFHRNALESLRQPLEENAVTISRTAQTITYPCRFLLGAAMNPCPCGLLMDRRRRCLCRMEEIARYRARISGPLLDRIDIHLELQGLSLGELESETPAESSARVRMRVEAARDIQGRRFKARYPGVYGNAHMTSSGIQEFCRLQPGAGRLLRDAVETLGFSARAYDRILKVARTVADLEASAEIREEHLAEAVHYRGLDRRLEFAG